MSVQENPDDYELYTLATQHGLVFKPGTTRKALYNTLKLTLGKPRLIEKLEQLNQN